MVRAASCTLAYAYGIATTRSAAMAPAASAAEKFPSCCSCVIRCSIAARAAATSSGPGATPTL